MKTIKDIAKLAGVSPSTVSRIINNKDGMISEATRQRVLKIIDEVGYIPNTFARSLVTQQSRMLGMIIPDILNPYFTELAKGTSDYALERGYDVLLLSADDDEEMEAHLYNSLIQKGVAGILISPGGSNYQFRQARGRTIPIVSIDRKLTSRSYLIGALDNDNEYGAYLSASHLIEQGHRDILFLCGAKKAYTSKQRYQGYCKALNEHQIPIDDSLVYFGQYQHEFGYEIISSMIGKKHFTAICCMSDMLAMGALSALRRAKIKVPAECAVIGYDDIPLAGLIERPLSTIHRHTYECGSQAAEILINYIEGNVTEFVRKTIRPHLVIRET